MTNEQKLIAAAQSDELKDYIFQNVDCDDVMRQPGGDVAQAVELCADALREFRTAGR
jgi:hypothetical protein